MLYALAMLAQAASAAAPALPPEQVADARRVLDASLRDYGGSRFRGFRVVRQGERVTLCGEMNATNAMGGMTGWRATAIVLAGEPVTPRLYTIAANGYTGVSDFADRCPYGAPVMKVPAGATVEEGDATALIVP